LRVLRQRQCPGERGAERTWHRTRACSASISDRQRLVALLQRRVSTAAAPALTFRMRLLPLRKHITCIDPSDSPVRVTRQKVYLKLKGSLSTAVTDLVNKIKFFGYLRPKKTI
jgi:hypothetical protein